MKNYRKKLTVLLTASLFCTVINAQETTTGSTEVPAGVVGGELASPGDYPWMVSLAMSDGNAGCGASLIKPQWVLTAGHCYIDFAGAPSIESVIINSVIIDVDALEPFSELIDVEEVITHEDYAGIFGGGTGPDIALIRLSEPAVTTPVELATTDDAAMYGANEPAIVLGWGKTEAGGDSVDSLRVGNCKFISDDTCATMYAEAGSSSVYDANPGGNICAGYFSGETPVGAAQGDSGGPLFFEDTDGTYKQVGVVSGGNSDITTEDFPGVFTLVPVYVEWIDSVINAYEIALSIKAENREPLQIKYFANDRIEINGLSENSQYLIQLVDMAGNLIETLPSTNSTMHSFDVSEQKSGMYIAQIINQSNGQVTVEKFVVQ